MKFLKKATEFFLKYYKGLEHRRDFLLQENHTTYKGIFPESPESPETRKMDGILVTSFNQA